MRTALIVGTSAVTAAAAAGGLYALSKAGGWLASTADEEVESVLKGNETLLNNKEIALVKRLIVAGQAHLFRAWPAPGTQDASKKGLVAQLMMLDASYHGGLRQYIQNARKLLTESKEGLNTFEGFTPTVPTGEKLDFGSPEFVEVEQEGLHEAGFTAFVLVAGGLGERLGYSGIKVALPCESATGVTFLELYARFILALQAQSKAPKKLPFAIMTSGDTHARTLALLESHKYFGLHKRQVHLIKQEKVACLIDNDATLALDPADTYALQTKPHGHGDVHALLHSSGLAARWKSQGFKWVAFFQDTNALVFRALTAALGVSARHNFDMNSLAVPRKAKELIGAVSCLVHKDGHSLTTNVEYNQLDALLRSTISPEGDVNDASGWSPYPGNINQLIIKLDSYTTQLKRTGGIISEFVNPKYKDATKTSFKSSTRLECMMQDYPKALPSDAKVGFTAVNQVWASYSPVKNSPADAQGKFKEGSPTHSATTGELDMYKCNAMMLSQLAGATLPAPQKAIFNGIKCEVYPHVVLSPEFATITGDVQTKIKAGSVTLAPGAVLVLDGADITIEGPLEVSGALVIKAAPGAHVHVGALKVANAGWTWQPLAEGADVPEEQKIRGFQVVKTETAEFSFDTKGYHLVGQDGSEPSVIASSAATPSSVAPEAPAAASPGAEVAVETSLAPVAAESSAAVLVTPEPVFPPVHTASTLDYKAAAFEPHRAAVVAAAPASATTPTETQSDVASEAEEEESAGASSSQETGTSPAKKKKRKSKKKN